MRYGQIAAPAAIALSLGALVLIGSGVLERTPDAPLYKLVGGGRGPHTSRPSRSAEVPWMGRSVGKTPPVEAKAQAPSASGTGGAELGGLSVEDTPPASPDRGSGAMVAAEKRALDAQAATEQATADAANARQSLIDVTQASLAAQTVYEEERANLHQQLKAAGDAAGKAKALEADLAAARQREQSLGRQVAALKTDADAVDDLRRQAGAGKDAEAKVAALQAELSGAKQREDALGRKVASLTTDAGALEDLRRQASAGKDAEAKVAALQADLSGARQREDALGRQVASLTTDAGALEDLRRQASAGKDAEAKVAALQADLSGAKQREDALGRKVASLTSDAGALEDLRRQASAGKDSEAKVAALQADLSGARQREDALGRQVATAQADHGALVQLREQANAADARSAQAQEIEADLARTRRSRDELGQTVATLQAQIAAAEHALPKALPADTKAMARLRSDLDAAQAREGALRQQLAAREVQTPLASDDKPKVAPDRTAVSGTARNERRSKIDGSSRHEQLRRELAALKTQQMRLELQALRAEAVRIGVKSPLVHGDRAGPRQAKRAPAARAATVAKGDDGDPDRSGNLVARARGLIQSGQIDNARQILREASNGGNVGATRALADSYNPLANSSYGVIGVDSDVDKARFLYRKATRDAAQHGR